MPICDECAEEFDVTIQPADLELDCSLDDIERFYRMIADNCPPAELLDEFYRMFGSYAGLAPPLHDLPRGGSLQDVACS